MKEKAKTKFTKNMIVRK